MRHTSGLFLCDAHADDEENHGGEEDKDRNN